MDRPPHPGQIQVFDGEGKLIDTLQADVVGPSVAYVATRDRGWVPVVRIVETGGPRGVHWSSYDAEGALLQQGTAG